MNCDRFDSDLTLYLYGELSFDEEESLESHLGSCESCRKELEHRRTLYAAVDATSVPPPPALLASCRRDLFSTLNAASEARRPTWIQRVAAAFSWDAAWLKPVAACALLVAGFFGGRMAQGPAVSGGAAKNSADIVATRVRNVEPDPDGRVRIVWEETRQRTVAGSVDDEPIRKLLLTAAQDPANPGLRLDSVDLLRRESEDRGVRLALLTALQHDSNPGVRLKALEGLRPYASDPQIRTALAQVLLTDNNDGLRTQAIDLLIQRKERDMVGVLQELMQKESNDYIRTRSQRALREMNASVDTF